MSIRIWGLGLLFFLLASPVFGQNFHSSLGFRFGSGAGISLKYLAGEHAAIEGIAMYRRGGFRVVGLCMTQTEIGRSNTFFFAGVGGHVGMNGLTNPESPAYRVAGIDGVIGLEYLFPNENLIFSVDLKPMFEVLQNWRFSGNSGAVSIRIPIH